MFNISSLFSVGITISSTGSFFSILSLFDLVTASAILFPMNGPALWTIYLEASSPLLISIIKLILSSISKSLRFWSVNAMIILSKSVLYVSEILNYLVQLLTNKPKIYYE